MCQPSVDLAAPDRGNDALRKAKYLVRRRPEYFCGVALGVRFEYRVSYPERMAFRLSHDTIPWIWLGHWERYKRVADAVVYPSLGFAPPRVDAPACARSLHRVAWSLFVLI